MALPADWQAEVAVAANYFAVTYTHGGNQLVQLAIEVPNPAEPTANSLDRVLAFRGDGHAEYQVQDTTVATADRWLLWNEPGHWAGDPLMANSVRSDNVPYFMRTTGITEAMFWQVANSLRPIETAPSIPQRATSLDQVDWASVHYPMIQCGQLTDGQPNPGVTVQPVVLAQPELGVEYAIVVVACQFASNPPNAVFAYDAASSPTTPHLAQTLITEHDYWVATGPPVATGPNLALHVNGYQGNDPGYLPSVHATLTWTWTNGSYRETSPEPSHSYSGPP